MARFEVLQREKPLVIFDGAHNAEGISVATESIRLYFGEEKVYVLSGVLRDKDYVTIAEHIASVASRVFTITPENPRALDASTYASVLERFGTETRALAGSTIEEAFLHAYQQANENGCALVVLGSLYTYGNVFRTLEKIQQSEKNL